MQKNKNTPKIILAITVALFATLISYSTFSSMRQELNEQKKLVNTMQQVQAMQKNKVETYAYAIATKNLKAGEIVSEGDVDFKNFTIEDRTAFENRSDVVNKVLLRDINIGTAFTQSHIAKISNDNVDLRDGYRALTLPADNFQGKSAKIRVGSLVDVYSSSTDSPWVLEGIRILSFESNTKSNNNDLSIFDANSITFEVPVAYVPDFISNVSKNKIMLVTRGANDRTIRRSAPKKSIAKYDYSGNARLNSLPRIPKSIQSIGSLTNSSSLSDLPAPIQPQAVGPSVEVIEANVKSKVTFD